MVKLAMYPFYRWSLVRGDVTKERAINSIYTLNIDLLDIPVSSEKKHYIRSLKLSEFSEEKLMLKGLF